MRPARSSRTERAGAASPPRPWPGGAARPHGGRGPVAYPPLALALAEAVPGWSILERPLEPSAVPRAMPGDRAARGVVWKSPWTVLEAFREAEAERLLSAGRLPLGEVALRLGFSDQTAWNRAFRRWKGMSPTEWSVRHRGGGPAEGRGPGAA